MAQMLYEALAGEEPVFIDFVTDVKTRTRDHRPGLTVPTACRCGQLRLWEVKSAQPAARDTES